MFPFNHLSESAFDLALFELANGPINFDPDRLECLKFNPLDNQNIRGFDTDLDPDKNFPFATSLQSKYYPEYQASDLIASRNSCIGLSILHVNSRSLYGNFDTFKLLLNSIDHNFSV